MTKKKVNKKATENVNGLFRYTGDVVSAFNTDEGIGVSLTPGGITSVPKKDKNVLKMIAKGLLTPITNKN